MRKSPRRLSPVAALVLAATFTVGPARLPVAEAFATTDFRPDLSAFSVPTLIIHGTSDKTVPIDATGRAAARAVPHAKLVEYDGAPHGLFVTHKDRLTNDLLAFLGSVSGNAAGGSRQVIFKRTIPLCATVAQPIESGLRAS